MRRQRGDKGQFINADESPDIGEGRFTQRTSPTSFAAAALMPMMAEMFK